MYTENDKIQIRQSVVKYSCILAVMAIGLITLYVLGLKWGLQWVSQVTGAVLYGVICYMWLMYLWPCIRYWVFLKDMGKGLSREVTGRVVEVSGEEELQDGVRVYPVRILLDVEEDERIVYLNVSKSAGFPASGARVRLNCFGRHIKEIAAV